MPASRLLTASFLCLLCAAGVQAQPSGPPGMDRLLSDLHLTPDQQDGWQAFSRAYAMDPHDMQQRQQMAANMASMTAPQRVDMAVEMEKSDLAAQERRGEALKSFYAILTPQQRQVFDRETLPPTRGQD